jgi:hypothetical protein
MPIDKDIYALRKREERERLKRSKSSFKNLNDEGSIKLTRWMRRRY